MAINLQMFTSSYDNIGVLSHVTLDHTHLGR